MKNLFMFLILLFAITIPSIAQITGSEGLNMPGGYDSWNNPPTINAFAGIQKSGGTFLVNNDVATQRYQTLIHAASSGGDVVGGTYGFLFTSGPTSNYYANKWTDVTVSMNTIQTYTWHSDGGGTDNSVTFVNDNYYTVNWKDNGYANTEAIFMVTSAPPVSITSVSQSPTSGNVLSSTPVTVTVNISGSKSPEELFYVRYTTDNWSTSTNALVSFVGTTGTATIPKQAPGTTVSYYVYSTTVTNPTTNHDMYTIRANTNGGSNYSYTVDLNLFVNENFDYPVGDSIIFHNWSTHSAGINPIRVVTPGLTYTGYTSSGIGNAVTLNNTGEDDNLSFTPYTNTVYSAFMVNVSAATTAGDYFFHLGPNPISTTFRARVFVKQDGSNNLAFGISKGSSTVTYTGYNYSLNTTYLIVVKYLVVSGTANDTCYLFVNPVINGTEPTYDVKSTDNTQSDINVGSVALRQGSSSSSPTLKIDGIRLGDSWAGVLPVGPTPTITLTGTLSDFGTVAVGSNSAEQTYTVKGENLTDDITVTAPTDFEISKTTGSGFGTSLTFYQTGGTVAESTIYVRFSPTTTGSKSGNITHTSTGATTQNQAVSGYAISAEPTVQASSVNFTNVQTTSMTVNWTSGDGANRIVLMKQGSAVNSDPVDANSYTANSSFGSGDQIGTGNFVVYSGSGNSVTVTNLSPSTTYYVAVYEFNGSAGTENYLTPGTTGNQTTNAPANSQNSDIIVGVLSIPSTISSLIDTQPEQIAVFDFKVRDGGGSPDADAVGTILNSIRVVKGSSNNIADWTTTIQGAELFNGTSSLGAATINADSLVWSGSPIVTIPDDDSLVLTVKIYLKSSLPVGSDGKLFEFQINQNANVTVDAAGSFMADGGSNVIGAPGTAIDVTATQLAFTTQPQTGKVVNQNIAPVAVTAQDANQNTDLDFSGNVTLSSGTFTLASTDAGGLTQAALNGVASWTNLTSSTTGTGTILADAAGLTQGVSNSITVLSSIVTSVQSGNWSAGTTWDQGSKPTELQTAIIASGHTVTLTANDTCEAATVQTGGVLDCGNYALRLHGTFTLDSGAEAKMSAFNPLPGNGPTPYAFDIASTFTFYGTTTGFSLRNPSVQTVTFGNVNWISTGNATPSVGTIIAGDLYKGSTGELRGGTGTIARVITVLGNVVVDGGTLVCNNGTTTGEWDINGNLTINANGTLRGVNYTGNGTLRIGGNLINNGGIIQVEDANGGSGNWIVYFKGTGTTTLDPGAVNAFRTVSIAPGRTVNLINHNMTINSTYTMTDSGTFNCGTNIITGAGNFTLEAGATLGIGSPDGITASSAAGNIQVTGTRTFSSAANYVYNGSAAQVTGDGLPTNVNNLTINNSSGVTLSSNHTVDGTLYLMSGNLNTGVDVLTIAQTGSVNRTSGHVVGNLNKYLAVSGGSGSQTWEIGDASVYTPVDISGTSYASGFDLTASTTTGEHPNIGTSNINPAKSVNRYYTLTGTPTGPSSVTFHFDAADVDGGANASNFIVGKYDNPTWTYPAVGTRTSTSTQVTGVTSFSDFAIGEVAAYTIVATAGPHGVIDPSGTVMVNSGEDQRFVFDPEACYKVDSVFVDGVYVPDSTTSYTFKNVTDNHTIHVTFAAIEYTITVTQGANGTITPGTTVVGCGSDLAFSITPNAGYHVDSVFVDGSYVPDSTTSYTFKNITANHSITAKFAINTYTLNVVVVGSGSVTKDPDQTLYEHGTSVELTAVPADLSWKFKEWSGDLTGTENPKSIVMNGPKSVTATFERDSSYLVMYRSFDPDSIADSKDLKGKYKYIPRKATACEFEFELIAPQSVTLTLKFSMASDGVVLHGTDTVGTWTNAKTVTTSAIDSGEVVHVIGWGYKGKPVKTGYIWATLPKSMKGNVETYIINQPRLPMPNRLNAVNDAFALGGFPSGLQVGLDKSSPDSTKLYGWLSAKKYGDVAKTLNDKGTTHSELPHGFDFWISGKPFVKLQKSLSPNKYDNILLAQMVALKLNITASAMEILPLGFGELIFDDATLTPPAGAPTLNGLMVKEVAAIVDSVMMGWTQVDTIIKGKPVYSRHFAESDVFDFLNEAVTEINNAFEGELDTLSFSDSLKFKGAVMLVDVPYLRSNSGVVPAKITPNYANIEMVPEAYKLYQNYPNPFNPTTMIQFDVPEEAYVTLKIYNLLGQEVATLLDHELMTEGTQEVEFDATGFASGVYFYRLSAEGISNEEGSLGTFQTVKKMILMK